MDVIGHTPYHTLDAPTIPAREKPTKDFKSRRNVDLFVMLIITIAPSGSATYYNIISGILYYKGGISLSYHRFG